MTSAVPYRTPREIALHAPTPADAISIARTVIDDGFVVNDRVGNRILSHLGERNDLRAEDIETITDGNEFSGVGLTAMLKNPKYRTKAAVLNALSPEQWPILADVDVDHFAETIVLLVERPSRYSNGSRIDVRPVAKALGPDRIHAVFTRLLASQDPVILRDAAESRLMPAEFFAPLLAAAHSIERPEAILNAVAGRTDLTTEQAIAFVHAVFEMPRAQKMRKKATQQWKWMAQSLMSTFVRTTDRSVEALNMAIDLCDEYADVRATILAEKRVSDRVRFHAARRGHLYALGACNGLLPVPADVAELALTGLEDRTVPDTARDAIRTVLSGSCGDDIALWRRLIDVFLSDADDTHQSQFAAAAAFMQAVTKTHRRYITFAETHPYDMAYQAMADHPNGNVRAHVVPALVFPEDVETASRDEHPRVRLAAIAHTALPIESLAVLASDPDPAVRAAVAADTRTPIDVWGPMAADPSPEVAEAVAERLVDAFA